MHAARAIVCMELNHRMVYPQLSALRALPACAHTSWQVGYRKLIAEESVALLGDAVPKPLGFIAFTPEWLASGTADAAPPFRAASIPYTTMVNVRRAGHFPCNLGFCRKKKC